MAQLPALLTTEEAAELLRVHPETIRRWVREGKVEAVDLPGRTVRIRRAELDRLIGGAPAEDGAA